MTILADWEIRPLALAGMIEPFVDEQVKSASVSMTVQDGQYAPFKTWGAKKHLISYGLSSKGYDMRIADEFRIFSAATGKFTHIDPKNFDESALVQFKSEKCIIPPNSFALGRSVEYFRIPRNILAICLGKSTYARVGIIVNFTPFEPEWEGHVTIEISNTTPLPCVIYANEGIAQVLFDKGEDPLVSYADRKGKYQSQTGITLSKV